MVHDANVLFVFFLSLCTRQFNIYSTEIARVTQSQARRKVKIAQSLAISITSYAADRGRSFPFVTLPDFELRVNKTRTLSESSWIIWAPLVEHGVQRDEWERFVLNESDDWMRKSMDRSGQQNQPLPNIVPRIHDATGMGPTSFLDKPFYETGGEEGLSGKYAAIW